MASYTFTIYKNSLIARAEEQIITRCEAREVKNDLFLTDLRVGREDLWAEASKEFRDWVIAQGYDYAEYECAELEGNPFSRSFWNEWYFAGKTTIVILDKEDEARYEERERRR